MSDRIGGDHRLMESPRILDSIGTPDDVKALDAESLSRLAAEIRDELVRTVASNGGHLAPNLGVVELTLGIHRALDCPKDRIVWDVGHQSYVHKLITGRRERFHTLRQFDGIAGFPKRSESPYDAFDSGHASDSLSIGLGMALAREQRGGDEAIVVVIGDGSLTGGMSFEALNHIGHLGIPIVIVLNDNEMSISPNVGALASYLARVRLDPRYQRLRDQVESRLASTGIGRIMVDAGEAVKESFKQLLVPGMLFEELGLKYVGPIDGHDIEQVESAVARAKGADGPVIIHAVTQKGCGYVHAEESPDAFHGIGPFSVETGRCNGTSGAISYTRAFSDALIAEAASDDRIVAITAAMPSGTGLDAFARNYPERMFDVGIAEEHAVGLAAGLALGGMVPVVAVYSTFMQRAYDQLILDVALQGLHVVFCLDRAGIVGEDGPTHHGVFDLAYLSTVPGLSVLAPSDEVELAEALHTALAMSGPVAIRYPRGSGRCVERRPVLEPWQPGCSKRLRDGGDVALLAVGRQVELAERVADALADSGVSARVVDMRWVKPVDSSEVLAAARDCRLIVTLEEGTSLGGFGSVVCGVIADAGAHADVLRVALPDAFLPHGSTSQLLEMSGYTVPDVTHRILGRLTGRTDGTVSPREEDVDGPAKA